MGQWLCSLTFMLKSVTLQGVGAKCSFVYIEEQEGDKPGAGRLVWRSGYRLSSPAVVQNQEKWGVQRGKGLPWGPEDTQHRLGPRGARNPQGLLPG